MRYALLLFTLLMFTACKPTALTPEQKQQVLLEEFEATKKLMAQSNYMTNERTNQWIKEFTEQLKLDTKDVEKNGFKLDIFNAKASQIADGNTISFISTWTLTMVSEKQQEDGTSLKESLPARRSVVYIWEPSKNSVQALLDSGFIAIK